MRTQFRVESDNTSYDLILSNEDLNNENFVELWLEEIVSKHDDRGPEITDPVTMPVKELLSALKAFEINNYEK